MESLSFSKLMPDHKLLLNLEPEELAGFVLKYLSRSSMSSQLNRYNFGLPHTVEGYPRSEQKEISRALMEAWIWLEREGLLAPKPGTDRDWVFITRKGQRLKNTADFESYRKSNLLPKNLLHPVIAQKVYHLFLRGDYDVAILQVFKEVEVAVRNTGGYTKADYGVDLMRKAFNTDNGPLTDPNQPKSEREATAHLFAGAIGFYKNPQSHRNVPVTAEEAAEIIMFASHLLRIVDSRVPTSNAL